MSQSEVARVMGMTVSNVKYIESKFYRFTSLNPEPREVLDAKDQVMELIESLAYELRLPVMDVSENEKGV